MIGSSFQASLSLAPVFIEALRNRQKHVKVGPGTGAGLGLWFPVAHVVRARVGLSLAGATSAYQCGAVRHQATLRPVTILEAQSYL